MNTILSASIVLLTLATVQAQTVNFTETNIITSAPDNSGNYEKAIGHFTSTSHVSYFLGTNTAAYVIDPTTDTTIVVARDGRHYESAVAYKADPGDRYDSIIASAGNGNGELVAYWNPANNNGGNANAGWTRYEIYRGSGCHKVDVFDYDGDGKLDVACSGTFNDGNAPPFIMFQDAYNNWAGPVYAIDAGDSIARVRINGVNGGLRNNLVGCQGSTLYWFQNNGRAPNWPRTAIGNCNQGVSLGTLSLADRDIVVVAANEAEPVQWSSGLAYFDPGTSSNPSSWRKVVIDHTYTVVHEIACDTFNGTPFCSVGEEEQASTRCNAWGYNTQSDNGGTYPGCRVAIYPWKGNGFAAPTIVSSAGTQNQQLYNNGDGEYMAGANHCVLGGNDCAYHLWSFTFGSGGGNKNILNAVAFQDPNGDNLDAGWALNPGWGFPTYIYTWSPNGVEQKFNYTAGGQLQSVANPSQYLYNNNGYLALGTQGGTFTLTPSGSGYVVKDNSSGLYMTTRNAISPPNLLPFTSTPTVWTAVP